MATFNSFAISAPLLQVSDIVQVWTSQSNIAPFFAAERMGQDGYLMPGPESTPRFVMRAFNTGLGRHVYWEVPEPDPTGQFSGYSVSLLTDIVIFEEICTENTHNG